MRHRDQNGNKLPDIYFNPKKAMHHYLSMAKGVAADHLEGRQIKI